MIYENNKIYLTWHDVKQECERIRDSLLVQYFPNTIQLVGISRGGVIPATIISHMLNLRPVFIDVHSFKDDSRGNIVDNNSIKLDYHKRIVMIDDIYDTGQTYDYLTKNYFVDNFYFIIDKREERFKNNNWYVFPWEYEK